MVVAAYDCRSDNKGQNSIISPQAKILQLVTSTIVIMMFIFVVIFPFPRVGDQYSWYKGECKCIMILNETKVQEDAKVDESCSSGNHNCDCDFGSISIIRNSMKNNDGLVCFGQVFTTVSFKIILCNAIYIKFNILLFLLSLYNSSLNKKKKVLVLLHYSMGTSTVVVFCGSLFFIFRVLVKKVQQIQSSRRSDSLRQCVWYATVYGM
jgi:hypothetical protein